MILKRLLVTVLGALGLGALAAGTASGQTAGEGNIPAPDIFDDQITCTQLLPTVTGFNLPSTVPMGGMTSPLDDLIGMGTNELRAGDATFDALTDGAEKLAGLGYVIPPMGMNCGAGAGAGPTLGTMNIDGNSDGDFLDVGDTLAWGSVPKDVADGYSDLLAKYVAVYGDPGGTTGGTQRALDAAAKALADELAKASPNQALVTSLTSTRDAAQDANNRAMAAFNAASGGPIYTAGVVEWMAKAAVTKSINDYNAQVVKTNTAQTTLNTMIFSQWNVADATGNFAVTQGASKYVPLTNTSLVGTVVTVAAGMGTVNTSALEAYTGGTTDSPVVGMAGVASMAGMDAVSSDSSASNFTALGALIVPMTAGDHDSDGDTPQTLIPTVSANGAGTNDVATIRTTVMNVRIAAAALRQARDANTNPRFQALYDEAYRRANLEQEYYDGVWAQVLADTTDTRTAQQRLRYLDTNSNGINEISEQTPDNVNNATNSSATAGSYYEANPLSIASRNAAYVTESNNRVAAEDDLRAKVAAREMATANVLTQFQSAQSFYQQLVDRRQALKATADQVVADATSPSAAQTKAAEDAAKALMDAETAKGTVDGFYDNPDDPTTELVNELLKNGGNDGQALVDAISATYDTAAGAADAAREIVDELTGDGGQVAMNTADIESLDGRVTQNEADIEALDGRVTQNEAAIETNAMAIMTNADNIATNAENIQTNADNIATNATDIMTNAGNIAMNNAYIMENRGMIETNAGMIGANTAAIAAQNSRIDANSSRIDDNITAIRELREDMSGGIAAAMALAGMPEIGDRGVAVGGGSYDGESAIAVGVHFSGENSRFKAAITSGGGETGVSIGAGWSF